MQAQDNLIASQAEIAIALARLYKALGGGWQLRCEVPYRGRHAIEVVSPIISEEAVIAPPVESNEMLPLPTPANEGL